MYKMADILSPKEMGNFKIDYFEIGENPSFYAIRQGIPKGKYTRLYVNGELAMSDTPMERRTNSFITQNAFGDILIGGLGLGMILLEIQGNDKVNSITVIEKHPEVIEIVGRQLPLNNKVKIIEGDIFTYKPERKYDLIWLDIWNSVNSDVYKEEMKPLKAKYRRYLKSKSENHERKVTCWAEWEAKNDRRLI